MNWKKSETFKIEESRMWCTTQNQAATFSQVIEVHSSLQ